MIVGIGVDVAGIDRFAAALERTPALEKRLFRPEETTLPDGSRRNGSSLAARFAAKEALAKALGAPPGLLWTDALITTGEHGRPGITVTGTVAARADALGVRHWHLSLSHDAGIATAFVVAEG